MEKGNGGDKVETVGIENSSAEFYYEQEANSFYGWIKEKRKVKV